MTVAIQPLITNTYVEPGVLNYLSDKPTGVAEHPRTKAEGVKMGKRIRIRGNPRPEPDVRLFVLALMELARQQQSKDEIPKSPAESQEDAHE
jgi:hypothetical protein